MSHGMHTGAGARRGFRNRKALLAVTAASMIALAGGGVSATAAQAETVSVVNGDFSAGTAGWRGERNTHLEATANGRNSSPGARLTTTSGSTATVTLNDLADSAAGLIQGHTYTASAWVRVEKPKQGVILRLLEEDAASHVVSSGQSWQWRTDTAWKQITTSFTATRTSSTLNVNVLGARLSPRNAVVIDDVTLVDTTAAAPTPAAAPAPAPVAPTGSPTADVPAPVSPTADAPTAAAPPAVQTPQGWNLAWSDEFNGSSVDRTAWNVENNSTYGDGNNELACLMDRPENVKVSDGVLTITARKEAAPLTCNANDQRFPGGRSFTSGMLSTKNKVDFEYGRFEISAKTPLTQGSSKGLWPAFWMRPTTGGIGELDILEAVGTGAGDPFSANRISQTIHYDYVGTHPQQASTYDLPAGTTADGFHTCAVEWAPGSIKWFVDGALSYERNLSTTSWLDQAFVNRFYLRLNMAVGGNWPRSPTADTAFPASYQVDYVRVYQH